MHIEHATSASDELVAAMARLIPQLSPAAQVPTHAELAAVVAQPGTFLLLARDPDIVGREAANRLYRRLGFQVVVTNTYRLTP